MSASLSTWCVVACSVNCNEILHSPFPARSERRADGLGTFALELARELAVDEEEISTTEVARAYARTCGWREAPDGWLCPAHAGDRQ